jgi:hypothetical protein
VRSVHRLLGADRDAHARANMTALIGGVRASSSSACFGTQLSAAGEGTGTGATAPSVPTTVCWPDARKMPPLTGRAASACFAKTKVAGFGADVGAVAVVDWDATTAVGKGVGVAVEAEGIECAGGGAGTGRADWSGFAEGRT